MAHSASPTLDTDNRIALVEDAESDGVGDAPLEAAIDVFLPRRLVEIWLFFVEEERVDAAVEVGVLEERQQGLTKFCA